MRTSRASPERADCYAIRARRGCAGPRMPARRIVPSATIERSPSSVRPRSIKGRSSPLSNTRSSRLRSSSLISHSRLSSSTVPSFLTARLWLALAAIRPNVEATPHPGEPALLADAGIPEHRPSPRWSLGSPRADPVPRRVSRQDAGVRAAGEVATGMWISEPVRSLLRQDRANGRRGARVPCWRQSCRSGWHRPRPLHRQRAHDLHARPARPLRTVRRPPSTSTCRRDRRQPRSTIHRPSRDGPGGWDLQQTTFESARPAGLIRAAAHIARRAAPEG